MFKLAKYTIHMHMIYTIYIPFLLILLGGERLPHSQTGRSLLSCWWVFCIVMMATYTGNLIAFLTVNKNVSPFTNVEEMLQQNQYKWGIIGGSYWVTIFKVCHYLLFFNKCYSEKLKQKSKVTPWLCQGSVLSRVCYTFSVFNESR